MLTEHRRRSISSLFLAQSCADAYEAYTRSLRSMGMPKWDYVIVTASNEGQAEAYRKQIERRLGQGVLSDGQRYAVLPDPDGERVGSGGATLSALRYVYEMEGKGCFARKHILLIHSGGDSKRIPQYSACGKLFAPIPHLLPDGRRSTLFDETMITMATLPGRMKPGMLVLSGDALLLFNPLQVDFYFDDAMALSVKESVDVGKDHGVFLRDETGCVAKFLHKQSPEKLAASGAVDDYGRVDLDTGAVMLSGGLLQSLFGILCTDGALDAAKCAALINARTRLSFYGDFLYPLSADATLKDYYQESAEGERTPELHAARAAVWEALSGYDFRVSSLSPGAFIHFGTTRELLTFMTRAEEDHGYLGWQTRVHATEKPGAFTAVNSLLFDKTTVGDGCYIEDSRLCDSVVLEDGCVVSGCALHDLCVPSGVCLHTLPLQNGRFVSRLYGVGDDPKGDLFMGRPLTHWLKTWGVGAAAIWPGTDRSLWTARLYPVCADAGASAAASLALLHGWDARERISMAECAALWDVEAILRWQVEISAQVGAQKLWSLIRRKASLEEVRVQFRNAKENEETIRRVSAQADRVEESASVEAFGNKMRAYYYTARLSEDGGQALENRCFAAIRNGLWANAQSGVAYDETLSIRQDRVTVELPVRVNWGGGWTDTPPQCVELGGTVLNAAIRLRGRLPVAVRLERLDEPKIILQSEDSGAMAEITSLEQLWDSRNIFDPFLLHKAALVGCGVIPQTGTTALASILERLGGGFSLSTQVIGVPRGSGLGTSSILAGGCVKALCAFFGKTMTDAELFNRVLCVEQYMSTGGGWQDQVGGCVNGVKFITSPPGLYQHIHCECLNLPASMRAALDERFCLIYTGQRRLARNLLREIVGKYIAGDAVTLRVLETIKGLAEQMRACLLEGDIEGFAALLNEHWEQSRLLDAESTNTCIDYIFNACEYLLAGRMICGAGGGGFLQAVLKAGVTREMLSDRLRGVFGDCGVDVWACTVERS